ncbi:MAG: lysophospholipase [Candidatus Thermoplasmatota archaeon]|nr:lysophospholipase [Candidatus Thermoplasmatota archaeon]
MNKVAISIAFGLLFLASGFAGCTGIESVDKAIESIGKSVGIIKDNSVETGDGFFIGCDNASIYYQSWTVENPVAVMFLVHGYGEHSGRYDYVARHFCAENISCYALDHRGHGRSTGLRCNVEDYNYWIEDLETFVKLVKGIEGPDKKYFMLGHSMGGGITVVYSEMYASEIDAFIYSAPALGVGGAPMAAFQAAAALAPVIQAASPAASDYATPYQLCQPSDLNHDPENTKAYAEDPLVYHGGLKVQMAAQFGRMFSYGCNNVGNVSKPCLFIQGSADVLVNPNATEEFYNNVSISDKKFILYDGFYHETLNEPVWFGNGGKDRVLADIDAWLLPRI